MNNTQNETEPSAGAMRAAEAIASLDCWPTPPELDQVAQIIERETGHAELVAALEDSVMEMEDALDHLVRLKEADEYKIKEENAGHPSRISPYVTGLREKISKARAALAKAQA